MADATHDGSEATSPHARHPRPGSVPPVPATSGATGASTIPSTSGSTGRFVTVQRPATQRPATAPPVASGGVDTAAFATWLEMGETEVALDESALVLDQPESVPMRRVAAVPRWPLVLLALLVVGVVSAAIVMAVRARTEDPAASAMSDEASQVAPAVGALATNTPVATAPNGTPAIVEGVTQNASASASDSASSVAPGSASASDSASASASASRSASASASGAASASGSASASRSGSGAAAGAGAAVASAPSAASASGSAPSSASQPRRVAAPAKRAAAMTPGQGTLEMQLTTRYAITLDGKPTGLHTPQRAVSLPIGTHRVSLIDEKTGTRRTIEVTIESGKTTKLHDFASP